MAPTLPGSAADAAAEALVRRWQADHGAMLRAWVGAHAGAGHIDVDEAVAETFVRAWRSADRYDPQRGSERAWLLGIARHVVADRHRTQVRRGLRVVTAEPPETPQDDSDLNRVVERSFVHDALQTLSDAHRTVLIEAYYQGRTTREIAARLDIPQGTVKSRLHHALRALRAELIDSGVLT